MKRLQLFIMSLLATVLMLAATSLFAQSASAEAKGSESRYQWDLDHLIFDAVLLQPGADQPEAVQGTVTALAAQSAAAATPESNPLSSLASYRDNIEQLIAAEGPFAPGLVQDYFAMGQIYQALDQHEEAIEAFEEANYITRINEGLATTAALDMLEAEIESHLALGDFSTANKRQQYLFHLAQEVHGKDSLEMVPLLSQLADRNVEHFSTAIRTTAPLISFNTGGPGTPLPNMRALAFGNLFRAQNYYYQAIGNLLTHRQIDNPELYELENKLLETIFLSANRNGFMENPDFYLSGKTRITGSHIRGNELSGYSMSFINGRNVYERMLVYLNNSRHNNPAQQIASVMVRQADWYLLYQHHAQALNMYQEALEYMQSNAVETSSINDLLNPELPVQLPVFTALPNSRGHFGIPATASLQHDGYIDVAFELSRYGQVKNLRILEKSDSASTAVVGRLKRLLRTSPFRPFYQENPDAADDAVKLRYYFSELNNPQMAIR